MPASHRRSRYRSVASLAAVIAVLVGVALAGCGGDDDDQRTEGTTTEGTATTQGTTTDPDAGVVEVPDHIPVEIAPGGTIDGVFEPVDGTMQDTWVVRILYPAGTYEDVVDFYDDHLVESGFDVSVDTAGPTRWRWSWTSDRPGATTSNSAFLELDNIHYAGADVLELRWLPAES